MAFPGFTGVPQFGGGFDHQFVPPQNVAPLPVRKQKNLTCRYWLYAGGGCPDPDEVCPFAHEDTGVLSNIRDQRGTCYHWKMTRDGCHFSARDCLYEHRDTGVVNDCYPVQGNDRVWHRHKLTGINLAIANAAERSGFNVGNKKALMELVFAVRRAGGLGDNYRPAPPATYPDRYRPGGGKRKRGHVYRGNNTAVVGHLGDHPVLSGSRTHPIDVDGDVNTGDPPMAADSSAKRQRTQANMHPDRLVHLHDNDRTLNHDDGRLSRRSLSPRYDRRARSHTAFNDHNTHEETMSVIRTISNTLAENEQATLKCADAMRKLWEADKRVQEQDVIPILQGLKQCLELGGNAAAEGVRVMTTLMRRIRDDEIH